jgi:hypothetical protein
VKVNLRGYLGATLAFFILWPVLSFAQLSDHAQILAACKAGRESCDRSKLSWTELAEVIASDHGRNVADCRGGLESCNHSNLSAQEAVALAVANHPGRYNARMRSEWATTACWGT